MDALLSRKKTPVLIHNMVADRSIGLPPSFSPLTAIEVIRLNQASIDEYATSIYWGYNFSM
jgi:hypothetical protein